MECLLPWLIPVNLPFDVDVESPPNIPALLPEVFGCSRTRLSDIQVNPKPKLLVMALSRD
jgi:hypothetical protein